jgi:methoxymalonate biosynthesis acyl carrier protein
MTANSVEERIRNVFVQHLHIQPPSLDKDLLESGTIDSLSFVELLSRLEQEFSIRISLDDLDLNQFRSIARIGEFIGTRLSTPAETSDSTGLRVAR